MRRSVAATVCVREREVVGEGGLVHTSPKTLINLVEEVAGTGTGDGGVRSAWVSGREGG